MAKTENMDHYIVMGLEQELDKVRARARSLEEQLAYHRKRAGIVHIPAPSPYNPTASPAAKPRKMRKLSAAGRKAISDAAKKRWAKVKAGKKN